MNPTPGFEKVMPPLYAEQYVKQPVIRAMSQAAVGSRELPEIEQGKVYFMSTNQCVNVDCGASTSGNNKSERLHLSDPHGDSSERREQRGVEIVSRSTDEKSQRRD